MAGGRCRWRVSACDWPVAGGWRGQGNVMEAAGTGTRTAARRQERRMRAPTTLEKQRDQRPAGRLTRRRWVRGRRENSADRSGGQAVGRSRWAPGLGQGRPWAQDSDLRPPRSLLTAGSVHRPARPSQQQARTESRSPGATPAAGASGNPGALTRSSDILI